MPPAKSVAVLGGGAAGFFAAIAAAEAAPGLSVRILERASDGLAKVRVSGGGRCNLTHACFEPKTFVQNYPRGAEALLGPLHRFGPRAVMDWFESRGVPTRTEADGRVFPASNQSRCVVDALRAAARAAGIRVETGVRITTVERREEGFVLERAEGAPPTAADRLLLATGASPQGWVWARSFGHTVVPPVPSLFTFRLNDRRLAGLSGLTVPDASLSLPDASLASRGPLLVTHEGLSGPAVLRLSAWGARPLAAGGYRASLRVDWTGVGVDGAARELRRVGREEPRRLVRASPHLGLPRRLWERLATAAGCGERRWADLSSEWLHRLAAELADGAMSIVGRGAYKDEFVTCGGVALDEVDFRTMESRRVPGLHFAGEILDVDGLTGGFNFQNAWTTGWLAGRAMVR